MTDTSDGNLDWKRAGRRVTKRFKKELGKTTQGTADDAGVSVSTLNNIREGRQVTEQTRRKVERALHWSPGTIERLARDPNYEPPDDRVVTELERLERVEAEVADLKAAMKAVRDDLAAWVAEARQHP